MNKKTIYLSLIIGLILGSAITIGIGVSAISLNAKEITYSPKNPDFKVKNSDEALNFLYKLSEYGVPADTYFFDKSTKGNSIQRYKKIKGNFYKCNENGDVSNNEPIANVDISSLIEYKPENVGNMAAGSAGYANKNFLLGNGLDILTAENEGYVKGYADGKKDSNKGNGEIVYQRHKHTGSPKTGGGCYTKPIYHTHDSSCYRPIECWGTWKACGESGKEDWSSCPVCGASSGDVSKAGQKCTNIIDYELICNRGNEIVGYNLGCGKKEGEIESATIVFK